MSHFFFLKEGLKTPKLYTSLENLEWCQKIVNLGN